MADGQTCRAPKCEMAVSRRALLACPAHWNALPLYLRNEIRKSAGNVRAMDGHILVAQAYWRAG